MAISIKEHNRDKSRTDPDYLVQNRLIIKVSVWDPFMELFPRTITIQEALVEALVEYTDARSNTRDYVLDVAHQIKANKD